jgi:hypothetical protein
MGIADEEIVHYEYEGEGSGVGVVVEEHGGGSFREPRLGEKSDKTLQVVAILHEFKYKLGRVYIWLTVLDRQKQYTHHL